MASVRTYGSSALNMEAAPQRQRQRVLSPEERQWIEQQRRLKQRRILEAQRAEERKKALARRENAKKIGILVYVCALFAVLSVVVLGYAHVANLQMQNNALQKQMNSYNDQIADLQLQLSQKTDLQYVKQQAHDRLDMDYPKPYQVLKVELTGSNTDGTGANASNQSGGGN